jgi:hypothetical protein
VKILVHLYISVSFLIIGALIYKLFYSPALKYIGYSFWWAGWGWLVSWIVTIILKIEMSKLLLFIVIVVLIFGFDGVKAVYKKYRNIP